MSKEKFEEAEHALEAAIHGRQDLASEKALAALDELAVARAREESRELSVALGRTLEAEIDVDAMVSHAMRLYRPREDALPDVRSLMWGGLIGALAVLVSLTVLIGQKGFELSHVLSAASAGYTLTRALAHLSASTPWAALAIVGVSSAIVLVALARLGRGALGRAASIPLALLLPISIADRARAHEFEGRELVVSVDASHEARSSILARALESHDLGLSYRLASDPEISFHARELPLAEVFDALFSGESIAIERTSRVLIVRSAFDPTEPADSRASSPSPPGLPTARDELHDLILYGQDAVVAVGQEVRNVITMGGDVTVRGSVYGDVVTTGGDATISGNVMGDVLTMGGDIRVQSGARVLGEVQSMGGELEIEDRTKGLERSPGHRERDSSTERGALDVRVLSARQEDSEIDSWMRGLLLHALLFLAGLLFMGLAPDRLLAVRIRMRSTPLRTLVIGLVASFAALLVAIALAITIIGILADVVFVPAVFVTGALGVTALAWVIGSSLPIAGLGHRPVMQLAVGVLPLFLAWQVPGLGFLLWVLAFCFGLGAMVSVIFSRPV